MSLFWIVHHSIVIIKRAVEDLSINVLSITMAVFLLYLFQVAVLQIQNIYRYISNLMDESLVHFLEAASSPVHNQVNILHDTVLALTFLHSNDDTYNTPRYVTQANVNQVHLEANDATHCTWCSKKIPKLTDRANKHYTIQKFQIIIFKRNSWSGLVNVVMHMGCVHVT